MAETKKQATFSKEQLLKSEKYRFKTDVLNAVLEDGVQYTLADADKRIEKFLKGEVK